MSWENYVDPQWMYIYEQCGTPHIVPAAAACAMFTEIDAPYTDGTIAKSIETPSMDVIKDQDSVKETIQNYFYDRGKNDAP